MLPSTAITTTVYATALLALPLHGLQVGTVPRGSRGRGSVRFPSSHPIEHFDSLSSRHSSPLTTLHLLKGLVPTVDDDINREVEEASITLFELFQRELDEGASIPAAISAVRKRRKDKAGDYENKYKLLSDYRSYSNRELLDTDHLKLAPTLDDLNQIQPGKGKVIWASTLFRLTVFLSAFFSFPVLCNILNTLVVVSEDQFDIINDQFTPGIGILYGTFVALTLDILYERQNKVQENASVEASLLSQVTQNVLNLFRDETDIAKEATQVIADQVRIIVYRSRGSEMLNIMRADPYARLLSIVDHYQRDTTSFTPHKEALIDGLRSEIPALMEARAKRLSDEASALPPTHFLVLILLTALSLVGFTAATLTITDADGNPPLESRMVFAGLSAVYVLFFNFCNDMNDPFDGVYQIKRSSAASYLLQIKWLIASQPFGAEIKFDTRGLAPVYDGNEVDEIENIAQKVETSSSSEAPPQSSNIVADAKKKSEPKQEAATTMETSAPDMKFDTRGLANEVDETTNSAHKVETSFSNEAPPTPSDEIVANAKKESEPKQEAATTTETPALVVSITSESSKEEKADAAVPKKLSIKSFIPERKAPVSNEEMLSQFESLGGFSGDNAEGEDVTVPSKNMQTRPTTKQEISMYFRKAGGFGE